MKSEPALTIATITAFVTAAIGLLVAFGVDVTDEQRDAILSMVAAAFPIIILLGATIRQFVYAPDTVAQIKAGKEDVG